MTSGVPVSKEREAEIKEEIMGYLSNNDSYSIMGICKTIGISYSLLQRIRKDDPEFNHHIVAAMDRSTQVRGDFAESMLMKLIKEGNVAATIFYLKTRHKDRGYSERYDITGGGNVTQCVVNVMRNASSGD